MYAYVRMYVHHRHTPCVVTVVQELQRHHQGGEEGDEEALLGLRTGGFLSAHLREVGPGPSQDTSGHAPVSLTHTYIHT